MRRAHRRDNISFVAVRGPSGRGAHANVKVGPLVELSGPPAEAAAAGGRGARGARQQWTFSGSVDPAVSGARVVLQREYPAEQERWHTFAVGVVGADGRFAIVHALPARGAVSVRAVAHIKGDLAAASEPLSFTITATQNPQLTIAASSAAVSSGQPVTISGVDAGAAGQQVTLLARTAGGPFVALADDTAGAGGEYTFTTTPTQRTQYRVTSAAEQSSILLEGFKYLLTAEPAPTTIAAGARLAFDRHRRRGPGRSAGVPRTRDRLRAQLPRDRQRHRPRGLLLLDPLRLRPPHRPRS